MKLTSVKANLQNIASDLLVCVVKQGELAPKKGKKQGTGVGFGALDAVFEGSLSAALKKADFKATPGSNFLFTLPNSQVSALAIFVWEEKRSNEFDSTQLYRKLGTVIQGYASKLGTKKVSLAGGPHLLLDKEPNSTALIEGIILSGYTYTAYKSKKQPPKNIEELSLINGKALKPDVLNRALEFCNATILARDLINMPPNDCTPPYLVSVAKDLAAKGKLKLQVFDKAQLTKMGAHSFLSVAKGTSLPPFLIKLSYIPARKTSKTKVISLVGKGITYDTGGYSLKPGDSMIGMKGDMGGGAAVLGVMQLIAKLKPNCEVRGYIPTTENMISGEATRVGDIVTAMNGKTIEILNTDAEGRLILADALTLACRDKAHVVIDIATLTGACMVALGMQYAGLFTDDDALANSIVKTGETSGERYWRLPLAPEYRDSIKSKVADLKNISGARWAGATIGALFLQEFVTDCRWAHLDIAGPSDADRDSDHVKAGGVGFAVRTLGRYILQQ